MEREGICVRARGIGSPNGLGRWADYDQFFGDSISIRILYAEMLGGSWLADGRQWFGRRLDGV